MSIKVVVLDPMSMDRAAKFRALLPSDWIFAHATARGDVHLQEIIADADYAISGQAAVSGNVLRAAKKLKLLHKWGVGVDNFDLETARELGIKVARTTGGNTVPVAEYAIGLMFAAMRCIAYSYAHLKQGDWNAVRVSSMESYTLSGKTVGIIGFGAIGQTLARLLKGFGCSVLYSKRTPLSATEDEALGVRFASLPEILAQSDVISLNCPLTPETAGLIDKDALRAMKPTAVLINVARGGIVVEGDLIDALRNRVIHAAAIDVFEIEPLPPDSELLTLDNLVATPHLAWRAADTFVKTINQMIGNIERVARGEPIPQRDLVV